MWTVTFPEELYKDLVKFLFSTSPYENGCFLLANTYKIKTKSVLLVTKVIKPTKNSWNSSGEHALEPSSSFTNQCVVASDMTESSLIFVHTHPNPYHQSTFSWIDRKSNKKMFANLSDILPDRPLGSLVFSRKGICGVVFDKNKIHGVSKIQIVGNTLSKFRGIGFGKESIRNTETKFDRQIRTFGGQNQQKLQDLVVTVVGAGGTGSAVVVQLARMGIKNLRLVDKDKIDETNLPRVYGSKDADVGKSKVDVLRKHIRTFSKSRVIAMCNDVADEVILERLIESDVIFACTDNLTSRAVLNDISSKYYIPLIDVGCRIHLDNGSISQAIAKVQVVTPDNACLWCTGTLDGTVILQESLPEEEKTKLANEGYYVVIEKQPSVISLTTMAASMAVNKLLGIIGVFGNQYSSRTQIEIKDGFVINDKPEIQKNCTCRKNRGKGSSKMRC